MSTDSAELSQALRSISNIDTQVSSISDHVNLLVSGIKSDNIPDRLGSIEGAKLNVSAAYAVASLFYVLQNLQGQTSEKFPIQSELARIKDHVKKINEVASSGTTPVSNRSVVVDKEASRRVIAHHLTSTGTSAGSSGGGSSNSTSAHDTTAKKEKGRLSSVDESESSTGNSNSNQKKKKTKRN